MHILLSSRAHNPVLQRRSDEVTKTPFPKFVFVTFIKQRALQSQLRKIPQTVSLPLNYRNEFGVRDHVFRR
jgi:hypothetical protein